MLAAAENQITIPQPTLDEARFELRQPLAVHVQDYSYLGIESSNKRHELGEIVDVHQIALLRSEVGGDSQAIFQVSEAGGEKGALGIAKSWESLEPRMPSEKLQGAIIKTARDPPILYSPIRFDFRLLRPSSSINNHIAGRR